MESLVNFTRTMVIRDNVTYHWVILMADDKVALSHELSLVNSVNYLRVELTVLV
jgi:hypothetical protein